MRAMRLVVLGGTAVVAYAALEQLHRYAGGVLWPAERAARFYVDPRGEERCDVRCVALSDAGDPAFEASVRAGNSKWWYVSQMNATSTDAFLTDSAAAFRSWNDVPIPRTPTCPVARCSR